MKVLLFEQVVELHSGFFKGGIVRSGAGICKSEILAKICFLFLPDGFGNRFPALLRYGWLVEFAVETAVKVRMAKRAFISSADLHINQEFFSAGMTYLHNATI
jgi:hypothetical protein